VGSCIAVSDVTPKIHPLWDKVLKRTIAGSLLIMKSNGLWEKRACEIDEFDNVANVPASPPHRNGRNRIMRFYF
jgi:hypothetical protein